MKNKLFTVLKIANVILNFIACYFILYCGYSILPMDIYNEKISRIIIVCTKILLVINAIISIYIIFKKDKNKIKKNQILLPIISLSFAFYLLVVIIVISSLAGFSPHTIYQYYIFLPIIELLMFIDLIISKVKIKN